MSGKDLEPDSLAGSDDTTDEHITPDSEVDAKGADPSPADGDEDSSYLSIVRDAVSGKDEPKDPASQATNGDPLSKDAAATAKPQDDEGFSDVPFHTHPRFRQLISQRDEFKTDATQYRNITKFLDDNAMSGQDAAQGLQIMALMKSDPAAAWAELKPIVQDLLVRTGEVLPSDLRSQVDRGQMQRETAVLIAKERAQRTTLEGRMTFDQQVAQRQRQVEETQTAQRATAERQNAAAQWEMQMREKDSELPEKLEAIHKEVLWLQRQNGVPADAAGVTAQLKAAYAAVEKSRAVTRQRRPESRPLTGGRGAGNPRTTGARTMEQIVQDVVG